MTQTTYQWTDDDVHCAYLIGKQDGIDAQINAGNLLKRIQQMKQKEAVLIPVGMSVVPGGCSYVET